MIKRLSDYPKFAEIYLVIGTVTASLSMCSNVIYYGFGPGAIWNIGFVTSIVSAVIGAFMAFIRVITWPYGIYVLISNPDGFFPWLFYLWHQ